MQNQHSSSVVNKFLMSKVPDSRSVARKQPLRKACLHFSGDCGVLLPTRTLAKTPRAMATPNQYANDNRRNACDAEDARALPDHPGSAQHAIDPATHRRVYGR